MLFKFFMSFLFFWYLPRQLDRAQNEGPMKLVWSVCLFMCLWPAFLKIYSSDILIFSIWLDVFNIKKQKESDFSKRIIVRKFGQIRSKNVFSFLNFFKNFIIIFF